MTCWNGSSLWTMAAGGPAVTVGISLTRFIFQSGGVVVIDGLAKIEEKFDA